MTDDELLHQAQRDQIREILREVLAERDAAPPRAEQAEQEKSEAEELERLGRYRADQHSNPRDQERPYNTDRLGS